jgi:uncharacterized membrane protein YgcG
MKCPRCVQRIHRGASQCPHCGYSLAEADARFGGGDVRLRKLTDSAGVLRRADRQRVEAAMERFERRFPQLFFAMHTGGKFHETAHLRQFGFWLLNRGAFEDVSVERPNEAGILLVLDAEAKAAGISFGYLLDGFLDDGDTFECLSRAHAYWLEGRYADGVLRLMAQLERTLMRRSRQARRDPERFERLVGPPPQMGELVRRIRAGHYKSEAAKREVPK